MKIKSILGIPKYKKSTRNTLNSAYESCRIKTKNGIIEVIIEHLIGLEF